MKNIIRLYSLFQPTHYDLEIVPNKDTMTFSGTVIITGQKVGRPSKRITLHQKELKVTSAKLEHHSKQGVQEISLDRINLHNGSNEVRLHSDQNLNAGKYTITLSFTGKISTNMLGMYPSNFVHDGKAKQLIATQFESHHARRAFPCVDEPEAKATFQLTLTVPKGEVALSNTPAEKTSKASGLPGFVRTTFEVTPKMSTYLLAFVYGEMHYFEVATKSGIAVRSWSSVARPKEQLEYSAREGARLLDFYAEYYGIPYPLAKLDQVALPDFDAGAMENWGLVTYREIALLADPTNPSISQEQYVSIVVAHELAHQWFGNLVTMKWWDDLWLNESFASIMEHLALDAIHPDWQQWEMYTATDIPSTTSRDIYRDIQPVGVEINDVELIETAFDPGIVYAKGGRLIKMLREYIGDKDFSAALKVYFTKHSYGNTSREDLWSAMSEVSGKDIHALMTPWLTKPGLPVVLIDQDGSEIRLSQKRFALDEDNSESLWPVPLLTDTPTSEDILTTRTAKISISGNKYALFNQFGSGHYIAQYASPKHRSYIADQIEAGELPVEARINILNDMLLLARRGDSPLTDALELVVRMKKEDRDNVWGLMARALGSAGQLTEGDDSTDDALKQIRHDLAQDIYESLGWDDADGDDMNTKQLRHTALAFMVGSEDTKVIAEAKKRYSDAKDLNSIDAEIRGTILVAHIRHGSESDALELLDQYEAAAPDLQHDIASALASTRDPVLAKKIMSKAFGPKGIVRDQDVMRWLVIFLRNHYIRETSWAYLVDNFEWFDAVLSPGKQYDYLPTYCASMITTLEWKKKYDKLFEPLKSRKELQKNILIGESDIAARIAWRNRDEAKIKKFLTDYTAK